MLAKVLMVLTAVVLYVNMEKLTNGMDYRTDRDRHFGNFGLFGFLVFWCF